MSKQTVHNEDVYKWLGDDAHDLDNLVVIIGDIANGDYLPEDLLSDIIFTKEQDD